MLAMALLAATLAATPATTPVSDEQWLPLVGKTVSLLLVDGQIVFGRLRAVREDAVEIVRADGGTTLVRREKVSEVRGGSVPSPAERPVPQVAWGHPVRMHFVAGGKKDVYDVFIDGEHHCSTPCDLDLVPGAHRASMRGAEEFSYTFDVPRADSLVTVERHNGWLRPLGYSSIPVILTGAAMVFVGEAFFKETDCYETPNCDPSIETKVMLGAGAAVIVVGVGGLLLGFIGGGVDHLSVTSVEHSESHTGSIHLDAIGIAPLTGGGAMAGVRVSF